MVQKAPVPTSNETVVVTGVLPLSQPKLTGLKQNGIIKLNWQTDFEQSIKYYEVQKSNNGVDFKKIGTVTAIGNSTVAQHTFMMMRKYHQTLLTTG